MRIIPAADPAQFTMLAADWLADHVRRKPRSVLALPTGNTPIGLYAELVARAHAGRLSFESARLFNLDEYCGLGAADPRSYAAFIDTHLVKPLRMAADQVCLLRGDATDLEQECHRYDAALAAGGGIDVCVLGLGVNGHIAFNEPGTAWDLRTHIVRLSQATRSVHAAQAADPWRIPAFGITMGIHSLLGARHVLLLIAGANKEAARLALHRGVADIDWPVTSLLGHPSLTTIELCAPSMHP